MRLNDARVQHLLMQDPRETKQPAWMQDSVNGLRGALRQTLAELETLRGEKPTTGSDIWLEVGEFDSERYVGLGHRARVRIPIGDDVWPGSGQPKQFIEVEAGREYKYGKAGAEPQPVSHVALRCEGGTMMVPMGSATNVLHAHVWQRSA